ncbi:FecR domain-containing protein [Dyadobacter sp. CY261]|uniref:FecR domain-containing protein n=1 Tax=Dyadobacter sp. CY261 TaxID=2907203 RepID=UPI001F28E61D|nr:FecR domain-containing protein [Dyadobacter sp. CY261]MCF0069734.1 FecR domain-containing protein [Dyadobacter sp. CY261]
MKTQITQELLFSYFSGQVSPIQRQIVDQWAKDPEHREQFYEWLHAWESYQPQYLTDVEQAMARHAQRMSEAMAPGRGVLRARSSSPTRIFSQLPWKAAAAIVLMTLLAWQSRNRILNKTYHTHYGETRQVALPDGSSVTLNANSSIAVPRFGFIAARREVILHGEAVFSVKHTWDHKPFVVKTDQNFEVLVLGTEFAVYNRGVGGKVVLNRGKVQLRYKEGPTSKAIMMKPGELVKFDSRGSALLQKVRNPESLSAWRDNRFVFENTSLTEISLLFKDTYGLDLVIPDPELGKWTVSGSFTAHNADELLEILMDASSLTYIRSGNRIQVNSPTYSY